MTQPFRFPRSTPEAQGMAPGAILDFINAAEAGTPDLHSFMIVRHGAVVAEGWWSPYAPELPHMLFSLSKSYTSTAVGFAVAEGLLTVDDRVISFFPDDLPQKVGKRLEAMRVHDLLSMAAGHGTDTTYYVFGAEDGNWPKAFLARPLKHKPGTHFLYNTGATYMLSAIITKLTGQAVVDYLKPRLFDPLGIEGAQWDSDPQGISVGGSGLHVRTEDIARLGQFYLQKGTWQGKQLLPEAWIAKATSKQISNGDDPNSEWAQGYGYQFWRCRHNCYRGDGAFGQYCIVMPEQDAVVAITSGVKDMQAVMNLIWDILLPAMAPKALPEDAAAQSKLADKAESLVMPVQIGDVASALAAEVSGKTYTFEPNELGVDGVTVAFDGDQDVITFRAAGEEHAFVAGRGVWIKGETRIGWRRANGLWDPEADRVASSGAWTAPDTYTMKTISYLTPFVRTATLRFAGDEVTVNNEINVSFGPTEMPVLVGKAKA